MCDRGHASRSQIADPVNFVAYCVTSYAFKTTFLARRYREPIHPRRITPCQPSVKSWPYCPDHQLDEQSQRRNIMAAAWSMPVEFEPPRVAIVVDKSTWTRELIERNGKFGIVIPGVAATNWTWAVGSVSGREEDKFNCYGIPVVKGPVLGLPLVEEKCLAWMECRLLPATSAQEKYDTLFGEVVSAAADARVFVEGRWQFDDDKLNTLHHLGAGTFVTSGKRVTAG